MYFSDENAQKIDFIRFKISEWEQKGSISIKEKLYLLSSLEESISHVANVAGVYGAYLKTWDSRATKPMKFLQPADMDISNDDTANNITIHNDNIEDTIQNIDCDILYLDPPYTKNSYSVQYHILETIVRNDNPEVKGITGARKYQNIFNNWSKQNKVDVLFEYVVAKTKAKHIVFSYSSDGLMSKEFIMNVLKRHCLEESVECQEIDYKKYQNFKTSKSQNHKEYLFYGQKKTNSEVNYYCPLNYMGGKTPIIDFIKPHLNGRSKFVDLMGGGFNVGINTHGFKHICYNDINFAVANILKMFRDTDTTTLLSFIEKTIEKYGLSKNNSEAYNKIRADYNQTYRNHEKGYWLLYVVILYGFQQQLRFNSNYEFNNPVGESGYSDSVKEKIISFSRRIKEMDIDFHIGDYEEIFDSIDSDTVVYVDPPYLITLGSYNDGKRGFKGWNDEEEKRLLNNLDVLIKKGCKIVISNLTEYKGIYNQHLNDWIEKHSAEVLQTTFRGRNEKIIIKQ